MQYSMVAIAALVAGASAHYNVSYTTEIVDSYTTFCPYATQVTHAEQTYTVTEATLLTVTNCPCTLTKPVIPVTSAKSIAPVAVSTSTSVTPAVVSSAAAVEVSSVAAAAPAVTSVVVAAAPSVAPPIYANTTTPAVAPVAPTTAAPASFKGAANSLAASGFSLAGVLAIAAYLL